MFRRASQTVAVDPLVISILIVGGILPALLFCFLLLSQPFNLIANIIGLAILLLTWAKMWRRWQKHNMRIAAMHAQAKANLENSYQLALARLDAFSEGFRAGLEASGIVLPPLDESVELDADSLALLTQFNATIGGRLETAQKFLGDPSCAHSAESPYIRCAINPIGPCEGCSEFKSHE
jgi:hypothetical protein